MNPSIRKNYSKIYVLVKISIQQTPWKNSLLHNLSIYIVSIYLKIQPHIRFIFLIVNMSKRCKQIHLYKIMKDKF